ncbi:hypothetical protein UFOVP840_28 [uncultured Caudovirales phage]|uniref:DUF1515 domain-containing protein n=1 Tax=uncultured Caudovirales phage TaxID=2100421 RepID=A0A6J5P4J5_9CAUD|nr:hypothetical protein UFOVP840_28 [uncultured Caudovirales phage]
MSDSLHREMGAHEKAIETLEREVREMRAALVRIEATLAETKGGVRTLLGVASVAGAVGAGLVKWLAYLKSGA